MLIPYLLPCCVDKVAAVASKSPLEDLKDMVDEKRRPSSPVYMSQQQPPSSPNQEGKETQDVIDRKQVLLRITGSVAAVKGPELAVRLVQDMHVHVRILLTGGGFNFWNKAREYDPLYWGEVEKRIF